VTFSSTVSRAEAGDIIPQVPARRARLKQERVLKALILWIS
jgi:hypothetical protein